MFRPSDERRIQAILDALIPPPYEAELSLEDERKTLRVVIADPDDAGLIVAQAVWTYDEKAIEQRQPRDGDLEATLHSLQAACAGYPAKKAADAAEQAERQAREAANLAARQADAREQLEAAQAASIARQNALLAAEAPAETPPEA